jgi:hypothetical protein
VGRLAEHDEEIALLVPVHAAAIGARRLAERRDRAIRGIQQQEAARLLADRHAPIARGRGERVRLRHGGRDLLRRNAVRRVQRQPVELAAEQHHKVAAAERHRVALILILRQLVLRQQTAVERVRVEPTAPPSVVEHAARSVVGSSQTASLAAHRAEGHRPVQLARVPDHALEAQGLGAGGKAPAAHDHS